MMLYSSVSPKLRIQTEKPAFAGKEGNSLGKEKELALCLKKKCSVDTDKCCVEMFISLRFIELLRSLLGALSLLVRLLCFSSSSSLNSFLFSRTPFGLLVLFLKVAVFIPCDCLLTA